MCFLAGGSDTRVRQECILLSTAPRTGAISRASTQGAIDKRMRSGQRWARGPTQNPNPFGGGRPKLKEDTRGPLGASSNNLLLGGHESPTRMVG